MLETFRESAEREDWLSFRSLSLYGCLQVHVGIATMAIKEFFGKGAGRFDDYNEPIGPQDAYEAGKNPLRIAIGATALGAVAATAKFSGLA